MGDAEKSDPQAVRFRAFVSYSHADATIAQKLHRKIETYRLPHHLRDRETDDPDNGRMGRIFRDREDLPAAEDLSESVKQALAGSEVLVVICSPDAKASIWVAREIELFRALHPGRPVLAALVRGEPEEAFPEALLHGAEPLAADLRKEGDGWRLGFLKIIAGIAGVPLDALVQRDATRRIRRVMTVTGGALVALLAMIGMTIFALQSRNEAQHQQAEAEGLVEYMLTDLRTELKGVGRLDVMTKVNERAMDYYEDQGDLSDMPAESLERRARVVGTLGIDEVERGNGAIALRQLKEWDRTTQALLDSDPSNPDWIFAHAESKNRLALFQYSQEDRLKALVGFKKSAKLLQEISSWGTNRPKWSKLAAIVSGNICALRLRGESALMIDMEACQMAVIESRKLLETQPSNRLYEYDLIFHLTWLGEARLRSGQFERARESWRQALERAEKLVQIEPENMLLREQQMELYGYLAGVDPQTSMKNLNKAISIAEELVVNDKSNNRWRDLLNKYINQKGNYHAKFN